MKDGWSGAKLERKPFPHLELAQNWFIGVRTSGQKAKELHYFIHSRSSSCPESQALGCTPRDPLLKFKELKQVDGQGIRDPLWRAEEQGTQVGELNCTGEDGLPCVSHSMAPWLLQRSKKFLLTVGEKILSRCHHFKCLYFPKWPEYL